MVFQQLCCSGVVGYQQVQANFLRAVPVPLPRQVFLCVYFGVHIWANSCKYVAKKGVALEHCRTHVVSLRQSASRALLSPCMGPRCDLFVSLDVCCYLGGAIAGIDLKKAKQKATSIQIKNTPRTSLVRFGLHILHLRLAF